MRPAVTLTPADREKVRRLIKRMDGKGITFKVGRYSTTYNGCPSGCVVLLRWMERNGYTWRDGWNVRPAIKGYELIA